MPTQREIVTELYSRLGSLPEDKQPIVAELAKRMQIAPVVKTKALEKLEGGINQQASDLDAAKSADDQLTQLATPPKKGFKQSFTDSLTGIANIPSDYISKLKAGPRGINPSSQDFSSVAPAVQLAGQAATDPAGAAGTVAGAATGAALTYGAGKMLGTGVPMAAKAATKAVGKLYEGSKVQGVVDALKDAHAQSKTAQATEDAIRQAAAKRFAQGGRKVPDTVPGANFQSQPTPQVPTPAVAPPVDATLPSGRKPGSAPSEPAPAPRKPPAWKDIPDQPTAATPTAAAPPVELPSGRKPGSATLEPPPRLQRAARPSDDYYKTHAQVKTAVSASQRLFKQGITAEHLQGLTDDQLSEALGKHSRETFNRILFELRGLETGKVKPE